MGETFDNVAETERSRELFARLDPEASLIAAEIAASAYRAGFEEGQNRAARLLA